MLQIAGLSVTIVLLAGCTSNSGAGQKATARDIYVFSSKLDFNETTLGIPHDTFTPDVLVVNKGDTVTVHFYNVDDDERHTFTIDSPVKVDTDVAAGGHNNVTFTPSVAGVFAFKCRFHEPTMVGQLLVQA